MKWFSDIMILTIILSSADEKMTGNQRFWLWKQIILFKNDTGVKKSLHRTVVENIVSMPRKFRQVHYFKTCIC